MLTSFPKISEQYNNSKRRSGGELVKVTMVNMASKAGCSIFASNLPMTQSAELKSIQEKVERQQKA